MSTKKDLKISKKSIVLISIGTVAFIAISIIGMYYFLSDNKGKDNNLKVESNVITSDNKSMTFQEMQAKADASKVGVKMNVNPVFEDGKANGNIKLENTSSNGNSFTVAIVIEDSKEIVYESGLIKKGTRIDEISLDKALEKGEYAAVAYFTAYNSENEVQGTSGINLTINVLN